MTVLFRFIDVTINVNACRGTRRVILRLTIIVVRVDSNLKK